MHTSLTNDELSALVRLRYERLDILWEKGVKPDGHPAGVQTFLWFWLKVVPATEFWVRLPFVCCSLASLRLMHRMGGTAAAAALLLSVPMTIPLIAARPYAPGLMFVLWTAYRLERKKVSAPMMAAAAYCHHFAALQVAAMFLWTAAFSSNKKRELTNGVVALLLYLPHLPITMAQLCVGGLGWLAPPEASFWIDWALHTFNDSHAATAFAVVLLVYSTLRYLEVRKYWVWFALPSAIMFFKSRLSAPVLHYYGPFFAAPFLFLTLGRGLKGRRTAWIWVAVMALTGIFAWYRAPWGRFRELHAACIEWKDADFFSSVNHPEYVYHYGREKKITANACRDSVERWMRSVSGSNAGRAAWVYSGCDEDEYAEWIRRFYPCLLEKRTWPGAGAYLFEKGDCREYENTDTLVFEPPLVLDAAHPYSAGWDSLPCRTGGTAAVWAVVSHCGGVIVLENKTWHGSKHCLDTLELVVRQADGQRLKSYFWNPDTVPIILKRLWYVCR